MSSEKIIRNEVVDFAEAMEEVLRSHDDEHEGNGWKGTAVAGLLRHLRQEVDEADSAFFRCDPEALRHELIDVANMAMMCWDVLR